MAKKQLPTGAAHGRKNLDLKDKHLPYFQYIIRAL